MAQPKTLSQHLALTCLRKSRWCFAVLTVRQLFAFLQMPDIEVIIAPPIIQAGPAQYSTKDVKNTKSLVRRLELTNGIGALWGPKNVCVIPDSKRALGRGPFTFKECPQGMLK